MEGLFVSFDFCGHYLVFGESCLDYWASVHLMTQMRWVASICGVSKIGAARVEVSSKNKRERNEREERERVCVCVDGDKTSARDRQGSCGQQFHWTIAETGRARG